ncbi:MAG: FtsX-like permease family protein [Anaerolineae bacterium]|nr:FtsX-like permease family protein [Anaerolineae bacterium]
MRNVGLWLRWSWRDLRARWLQVIVVALIIALGTGVYAGLGSTTPWREYAADTSYDRLNMYDLRIELASGSYLSPADLLIAVRSIDHADRIAAADMRLIAPTFVSVPERDILVRGELVGVALENGGPHVNQIYAKNGRTLTGSDSGQMVGMLEYLFATYYDLPAQGRIELSGGVPLDYVGHGMIPDTFMSITAEGGYMAQANFAVIFAPLATVQTLSEHPDQINDLVLALHDGAERAAVRGEIEAALTAAFPTVGWTITEREEDVVYDMVYQSIDINQEIYDIIAILFLAGAMFGAFNLSSRIVEAQRRQIGISMALGIPPRLIVIRPLLIGAQISILGALFGIVLGLALGKLAEVWMADVIPMPFSGQVFQLDIFARAAVLGGMLPFVATLYPVWRAVRVPPVDAIQTGHLVAKGGGLSPAVAYLPLPGRSFAQMPVRNLLRAPRRTLITALGIAAAITTLIGLVGILDSTNYTVINIEDEAFQNHPDRQTVTLNGLYPVESSQVTDITGAAVLSMAEPALRLPGRAISENADFNVRVEVLDLDNTLWTPTITEGQRPTGSGNPPGVLLAEGAALDLGLNVGDTLLLEHPRREGLFEFQIVQTEVVIAGLHADPWRMFVYLDHDQAGLMGLANMANLLHVSPAAGVSLNESKKALFAAPTVASVISVSDAVSSNQSALDEVITFLSGVQIGVFVLAFLIAFNSANISLNEREREVATMFAFGLPVRTVTRMAMIENGIMGVIGTLAGTGLGSLVVYWFMTTRMPEIMPELRFEVMLSPTTVITAVIMGVIVVALASLFTMRKMAQMDVPSTLRVME